ncbi:secretin N-terminal domain-containing protein [Minwuia sp.]|uniref:secretin N-terminal domain-containing protein n=1 Tax=Minwuia sp. TaxID=2493630 RepID=UPI003A92641B
MKFDKVLPRHAFEQIVTEQGLAWEYNPATRTVTLYADQSGTDLTPRREFITLSYASFPAIRSMLTRFKIGMDGIDYDPATRTVLVEGRADRIAEISALIARVENSAGVRQAQAEEFEAKRIANRRAEIEEQMYRQAVEADVKVIPLRFASVGATTRQFHGRSITVPGIEETLKAMLGDLSVARSGQPGFDVGGGQNGESDQAFYRRMQEIIRPQVSIDPRTNSVIVRGTPKAIASVEKVVLELDQPLKMIEIEVIIATAQVGVAEELGVAIRGSLTGQAGGNRSGAIDTGTNGGQVGNQGNGFDSNGLNALSLLPVAAAANTTLASFVISGAGNILQLQLNALEEENKAQVLSAPRLVTLDNITARITRAQDLFVQVDTGGDNGQGLAEIQTGLTLEITPSVVPSTVDDQRNLIRLSINAVNSAPGAGVFGQIDVRSQEVQTEVLVPNGGTYVVGGLFDDDRLERDAGVPGLKDVPLLGFLFSNEQSTNNVSETIFFITPRIIEEDIPFVRDIAERIGTPAYIQQQRKRLAGASSDLMNQTGKPFPNAIRLLEEDE